MTALSSHEVKFRCPSFAWKGKRPNFLILHSALFRSSVVLMVGQYMPNGDGQCHPTQFRKS